MGKRDRESCPREACLGEVNAPDSFAMLLILCCDRIGGYIPELDAAIIVRRQHAHLHIHIPTEAADLTIDTDLQHRKALHGILVQHAGCLEHLQRM